jgi:hypothetical protein
MNKLLFKSKVFLKSNSSTILTCIGGVGVVATVVTAVKATPKAMALIEEAKEEKGADLTKVETVITAAPAYITTAVLGVSTLTCIFGANALNRHQQASMMSAYALLENSYKEFKAKVQELYGEGTVDVVKGEIAKDKYKEKPFKVSEETELFYDDFSGRYFESTREKVLQAEYELNRTLAYDYGVFLNEWYEMLGIETVDYGDYLGWSSYELVETCWASWVNFYHKKVMIDDDLECTIITMDFEPTYDFENY